MFSIGERVLYGSTGVCEITQITTKKFSGNCIEYYVLKPLSSQVSTVFVPVDNKALVGKMRTVLSSAEIHNILESLSEDNDWNNDKTERIDESRNIISRGDCREIIRLIRRLYAHSKLQASKGRRLHIADERILKEAEKMVCDELSLVLNIDRSEVIPLVLK